MGSSENFGVFSLSLNFSDALVYRGPSVTLALLLLREVGVTVDAEEEVDVDFCLQLPLDVVDVHSF